MKDAYQPLKRRSVPLSPGEVASLVTPGMNDAAPAPRDKKPASRIVSGFKIESGIPLPVNRRLDLPLEHMRPGESYLIPGRKRAVGSLKARAREIDGVFEQRMTAQGLRIWRTK